MTTPFRTTRRVEFVDTDMAGLIHFSNYFRFMEAAEVEFLRAKGLSVTMLHKGEKLSLPRVSATCDFLLPVHFEEVLDVTVQISNLGRKSITYAFEFFKGADLVARGQISAVCCRILTGFKIESIEIPVGLRKLLE